MLKKTLIVAFSFSIFACTDALESKVVAYCMDTLNTYSSVTTQECRCFYDEAKKTLSESEIKEMIRAPFGSQGPLSTNGEKLFINVSTTSKCFD